MSCRLLNLISKWKKGKTNKTKTYSNAKNSPLVPVIKNTVK